MTAGSSILRSIAWPGKNNKRQRSGSGGSEDLENKPQSKEKGRRKLSGLSLQSISSIFSSKEQISSSNQTTHFKFSWPIERLTEKVDTSVGQGLDSKHFKIKMKGVATLWNLSIRFWTNEQGEQISNPFIFCLNLLECKSNSADPVEVTYKFGIYNRAEEQYDEGPEGVTSVGLDRSDQIQSVGVENVSLIDENFDDKGDILLQVRMSFNWNTMKTKVSPKVTDYLKSQPDEPDLVLVSGSRLFSVHKQVMSAASPVFAGLVDGMKDKTTNHDNKEVVDHKNSSRETPINHHLNKTPNKQSEDKTVDKIVIPDLPEKTVSAILRYIYTGSVADCDLSCHDLVTACTLYQLSGLQSLCEEYLATLLTPNTVASLLMLADNCSCDRLKRRALQYCTEHCAYIIKDEDWTTMEQDKPHLFEEACGQVAPVTCYSHKECVKNTRYLMERERGVIEQCSRER